MNLNSRQRRALELMKMGYVAVDVEAGTVTLTEKGWAALSAAVEEPMPRPVVKVV